MRLLQPSQEMYNDNYDNYFVVIEAALRPEKPQQMEEKKKGDMTYLRWRQCMQAVSRRNRNGRLWQKAHLVPMINDPIIQESIRDGGGLPGEAGHPVPDTGKVTVERILTVLPTNVSHFNKSFEWEGDKLYSIMESAVVYPGTILTGHMIQGIKPAVSARTVIPQRRNPDGTIDVLGPGRLACYDWVYHPSHPEAYIDISIPIKEISTQSHFEHAMESFSGLYADDLMVRSEKIKKVMDLYGYTAAQESYIMDPKTGMFSARVYDKETGDKGVVCIAPELKYRTEYRNYLKSF